MEMEYVDMKLKIKKNKTRFPRLMNSVHEHSSQSRYESVSLEDIDRRLKQTIIMEDGKKNYADIHLIKKGRDRIASSLSAVGQYEVGSPISSYIDIVKDVKNQQSEVVRIRELARKGSTLFCNLVKKEREAKKSKMMNNKYMHGNVYYNILSLSKR